MTRRVKDHVVLARLAALKLRGFVRSHARRLRTPTGVFFALVGATLASAWIVSIGFGEALARATGREFVEPPIVRLLLLMLVVLNVFAHLGQRGLFLQAAELDRLLSAPVPRSAILGHRLVCSLGRATVGALLLGAAASFRVPTATGAFLGALAFTIALTLLGQTVSLGAALCERRISARVLDLVAKGAAVSFVGAIVALALVPLPSLEGFDPLALAQHPVLTALALPLEPLVDTLTAATATDALILGLPVLATLFVAFELLRRWPVDWREVAIATSGRVGARLDRVRRLGTGASATAVSKWAARRHVPWLLGRSPMGAVFWRKSASILRRARVTLVFAGLTMLLGVGGLMAVTRRLEQDSGWATLFLIVFGSIYLSGGLRFDLREEVLRIGELKAWPLTSRRLFVALLLPQICAVGGFLALGCVLLALLSGGALWPLALAAAFLPVFLFGWVATDNFFFLLWPVRVVPGADGVLQDVGRASVLFLCRGLVAGLAVGLALAAALLVWSLQPGDSDVTTRALLSAPAAWLVLFAWAFVAVRSGGTALARFDPTTTSA
jgi:hypothetical protein